MRNTWLNKAQQRDKTMFEPQQSRSEKNRRKTLLKGLNTTLYQRIKTHHMTKTSKRSSIPE